MQITKIYNVNNPVKIVLIGIGGYGETYINDLLDTIPPMPTTLVAGVDPAPERCQRLELFKQQDIPVFPSTEAFYSSGISADLAIISSPISLHTPHTCEALGKGLHVLCEKPAAAVIQDVETMIQARNKTGRVLAIGYQWSYCDSIQTLKADVLAGHYGRPRQAKSIVLWARDEIYYTRNRWAGHLKDSQGRWVLDSPAGNACAHYLHNLFYLLGPSRETSARPIEVTAELFHANPIPNFDTGALRATTENGVEIIFITSHAPDTNIGPLFSLEFDKGFVSFEGNTIEGRLADGSSRSYLLEAPNNLKIRQTIDAIKGGKPVACGLEAASAQVLCLNGAHESAGATREFPRNLIRCEGDPGHRRIWVDGLREILLECNKLGKLPSELGVGWAKPGKPINLRNYHSYPRD